MAGRGTWWCFAKESESRNSPLVLVGAPTQGSCSPLVRARTKCSLRANSLTLCHSESPTTAHKLDTTHPQEHRVIFVPSIFVPPITTEPSRWWQSQRLTSKELSLNPIKALESCECTLELLELTKGSLKKSLNFQSSLGSCFSFALQGVSQLNKWATVLSWTRWRSINTPH